MRNDLKMSTTHFINGFVNWQDRRIQINGKDFLTMNPEHSAAAQAKEVYQYLGISYPKFFKMDVLSKAAFLTTEILLKHLSLPETAEQEKTATVITTYQGCLSADKNYNESRKTFPSPALFVYTLPNIMLGEICIRNGFKGEQFCNIAEQEPADFIAFYVQDLLLHRNTEACLCGFVNATEDHITVHLRWVSAQKMEFSLPFHADSIKSSSLIRD